MNSTHKVEIVQVFPESHPNADRLDVVRVFGYTACVVKESFLPGQLAAYIPPDSVVDSTRPEFAFLAGHERIKVKRLRGIISMGLLIPAPAGAQLGEDVAAYYGVTHYDPPEPLTTDGENEAPPKGFRPVYDVESFYRYSHVFGEREPVWVTEKLHGASGRYCYFDGRMHCGSRTTWKREDPQNLWWKCLARYPELIAYCQQHPEDTVYGEVYGQVQDLKYGTKPGEVRFAVFDILRQGEWLNPTRAFVEAVALPWVPCLGTDIPFSRETIVALAEGPSLIFTADHIREGIVIRPQTERTHPEIGRVCLKIVSNGYLER